MAITNSKEDLLTETILEAVANPNCPITTEFKRTHRVNLENVELEIKPDDPFHSKCSGDPNTPMICRNCILHHPNV